MIHRPVGSEARALQALNAKLAELYLASKVICTQLIRFATSTALHKAIKVQVTFNAFLVLALAMAAQVLQPPAFLVNQIISEPSA